MSDNSENRPVRKNFTLPQSFVDRLEKLKEKRGGASDSEIIRNAIKVLEALSDPNVKIFLREKDGKETEVIIL